MHFFTYTFKKILMSPSTYITLLIAFFIPGIAVFNEDSKNFLSIIIYFTMPLFIIFITFTAGKIFRDEVENKTILFILSKPIKRNSLIFEGFLSLISWVFIGSLIISLFPGFIISIKEKSSFVKPILVTLALFLLSSIFSSIALMLSLLMKGKAFIGTMLGIFGAGFYLLFGGSLLLQTNYSNSTKINQYEIKSETYNKNISLVDKNKNKNILFTAKLGNNKNNSQDLKELYDNIKDLTKAKPYSIIKWIDPSLHWTTMFGASMHVKGVSKDAENPLLSTFFESSELKIVNLSEINNNEFTFEIKREKLIPLWYPFVLWTTIGTGLILLSLWKINKMNIS